jgi:hypothetical protein
MARYSRPAPHHAVPATDRSREGPARSAFQRFLDVVECAGNKMPHAAVVFMWLALVLIVLSHLLHLGGYSATFEVVDPLSHRAEVTTTHARSLLTNEALRFMYSSVVANFMSFNAVGLVLVAMLGVGVAESAGLIKALIRRLVEVAPPGILTYVLVFVGILSGGVRRAHDSGGRPSASSGVRCAHRRLAVHDGSDQLRRAGVSRNWRCLRFRCENAEGTRGRRQGHGESRQLPRPAHIPVVLRQPVHRARHVQQHCHDRRC